jgi:hypothetical protein
MFDVRSFKYSPVLAEDEESEKNLTHLRKRIISANLLKLICLLVIVLPYVYILWPKRLSMLGTCGLSTDMLFGYSK